MLAKRTGKVLVEETDGEAIRVSCRWVDVIGIDEPEEHNEDVLPGGFFYDMSYEDLKNKVGDRAWKHEFLTGSHMA